MTRSKEFEKAVEDLLNLYKIPFVRVSNYRCFKCGQVQNAKASGFPDFFCLNPLFAIECKTGTGRLTKEQKFVKVCLEKNGIKYILLRDTVDELLEYLENL